MGILVIGVDEIIDLVIIILRRVVDLVSFIVELLERLGMQFLLVLLEKVDHSVFDVEAGVSVALLDFLDDIDELFCCHLRSDAGFGTRKWVIRVFVRNVIVNDIPELLVVSSLQLSHDIDHSL